MVYPWLPNILLLAALGTLLASVALYRQETETLCDLDCGNISTRYTYLGLPSLSVSQASNVVAILRLKMQFSPFLLMSTACSTLSRCPCVQLRSKELYGTSRSVFYFILTALSGSSKASFRSLLPLTWRPPKNHGSARSRASRPTMLPPP